MKVYFFPILLLFDLCQLSQLDMTRTVLLLIVLMSSFLAGCHDNKDNKGVKI